MKAVRNRRLTLYLLGELRRDPSAGLIAFRGQSGVNNIPAACFGIFARHPSIRIPGRFPLRLRERVWWLLRAKNPPTQLALLPAFLVMLAYASKALGQETIVSGSVVDVHDGDSITVLLPFQTQLKVRLANIDARSWGRPLPNVPSST
jgi:hypothetical protein